MTRWVLAVSLLGLALASGCDSLLGGSEGDDHCNRSATKSNPDGKRHGEPCTEDSECMYGLCYFDSSINAGAGGICTKRCSCGDASTLCSTDNPEGGDYSYVCFRPDSEARGYGDDLRDYCVPACNPAKGGATSVADWCADHDAAYTTCRRPYSIGTTHVCTTAEVAGPEL